MKVAEQYETYFMTSTFLYVRECTVVCCSLLWLHEAKYSKIWFPSD